MLDKIDEIQGLGLHLDKVLRKIQDAYVQTFANAGITMTIEQWVILHQIYSLGQQASQTQIVQTNFRNRATISRVIGGLQKKGWIIKSRFKGDQKRFKLELTPRGQQIITTILPKAKELRKLAVARIDPKDFDAFLTVLLKIESNYQNIKN